MRYVFTKRQLKLNEDSEVVVGNNGGTNKSINNLQSDLQSAMTKYPGNTKFGADSENYNQNSNDNDGQMDLTVTGDNAKVITDKVKQEINKSGYNPYKNSYQQGKLRIHAVKTPNTNESVKFTKKELNEFLRSI